MPESADWKQKYRDSLVEMESEEKRWRQVEQALRRLVGRLCAAAMGVDTKLDDELVALAAANRRNAPAEELERLAASLTHAVVAVDAVSPVPTITWADTAPRWEATCTAVAAILKHLKTAGQSSPYAESLLKQLPAARTDAELAALTHQVAKLAAAQAESMAAQAELLARERAEAATILTATTRRLEEMSGYLAQAGSDDGVRFADSSRVNEDVISQVRELSAQIESSAGLGALQASLTAQLGAVSRRILDFRSREERRAREYGERTATMRGRIAELERDLQRLRATFDREAAESPLDALTGIANRKSFDRRLAEELARRAEDGAPVAFLLWDLDDFAAVNETYGRRAGDRVLQAVVNRLKAALRDQDFIARVGGETFVVLLAERPLEDALRGAEDGRGAVAALRLHFRGTPVRVTISCGVTELRRDDTPGSVFERASTALSQAKSDGKNRCLTA